MRVIAVKKLHSMTTTMLFAPTSADGANSHQHKSPPPAVALARWSPVALCAFLTYVTTAYTSTASGEPLDHEPLGHELYPQ